VSALGEASGYVVPPRFWAWLGTRRTIGVMLWIAAFCAAGYFLWHGLVWLEDARDAPPERRRADGNAGHVQIDFGGQWVMGRMLVKGHGRELYHRQRQWEVVRAGFPNSDETPLHLMESHTPAAFRLFALPDEDLGHDDNHLMSWFMGHDPPEWRTVGSAAVVGLGQHPFLTAAAITAADNSLTPEVVEAVTKPAIGGPLYPPIHAFIYAPLGAIDRPQLAYQVFQVFATALVFVAAYGVVMLSGGRIRWSVAVLVLFLFPGTRGGIDLGQNPTLTFTIVIWGWVLASRGYNTAGGVVWGLFAFKPVWGLAFFLVPLLMRRWRFCAAMVLTGATLAALTLPFVGFQSWLDWLEVGKEAAAIYKVNNNWIHLSRDLHGIPRRILHDFSLGENVRDTPLANYLGWALWGTVFALTTTIYLRCGNVKRPTGVGVAFLFFGAYLTCYRFMFYDVLMIGMGCAVLFANPRGFLRTRVFELSLAPQTPPLPGVRTLTAPPTTRRFLGPRLLGYASSFPLTLLVMLIVYENTISGLGIHVTMNCGYLGGVVTGADGATQRSTPRMEFDTGTNYPWETFMAIALWAWCGWRVLRGADHKLEE